MRRVLLLATRVRFLATLVSFALVLLVMAPAALAVTSNGTEAGGGVTGGGGQGWYGESTDQVITNAMFLVIAFFPVVIITFSLIQWRLDKRKHERMDAAKRRAANIDWRGGW